MDRQKAKTLGVLLKELIEDEGLKAGLERIDIFNTWDNVVGTRVASVTTGKFFRDGILYCTVSSSMIRNRLYYNLEGIRTSINASLGSEAIQKIVLK